MTTTCKHENDVYEWPRWVTPGPDTRANKCYAKLHSKLTSWLKQRGFDTEPSGGTWLYANSDEKTTVLLRADLIYALESLVGGHLCLALGNLFAAAGHAAIVGHDELTSEAALVVHMALGQILEPVVLDGATRPGERTK